MTNILKYHPPRAAALLPADPTVVIGIKYKETGYHVLREFKTEYEAEIFCDRVNAAWKVSKAESAAYVFGSMFGWDTAGADPENWDDDGVIK